MIRISSGDIIIKKRVRLITTWWKRLETQLVVATPPRAHHIGAGKVGSISFRITTNNWQTTKTTQPNVTRSADHRTFSPDASQLDTLLADELQGPVHVGNLVHSHLALLFRRWDFFSWNELQEAKKGETITKVSLEHFKLDANFSEMWIAPSCKSLAKQTRGT